MNWAVFSCFDQKNWGKVKPLEDSINIACFHGAVWGSKTDIDWELDGEVSLDFFNQYMVNEIEPDANIMDIDKIENYVN